MSSIAFSKTPPGSIASGETYLTLLAALHAHLKPKSYFEIGTLTGTTLALANCASVAVDPKFQVQSNVIGDKPSVHFYQVPSDDFFDRFDLTAIFGRNVDLAFLDGMHLYEFLLRDFSNTEKHCRPNSIIALHDCIPSDTPMTRRIQNGPERKESAHPNWWTGDVWKVIPVLKKYRPDLRIIVSDAAPTGLVLVTNLDPTSRVIELSYDKIIHEMADVHLESYGLDRFIEKCSLVSAGNLLSFENLAKYFWL